MEYVIGIDIGKKRDYTALTVFRDARIENGTYELVHIDRFGLDLQYPKIVEKIIELSDRTPLKGNCTMVIDSTGIGESAVDMIRERANIFSLYAVTTTGGQKTTLSRFSANVPKFELVNSLLFALQNSRIKMAAALPLLDVLIDEALNYSYTISADTGHIGFDAKKDHDDVIFAMMLSVWYLERVRHATKNKRKIRIISSELKR